MTVRRLVTTLAAVVVSVLVTAQGCQHERWLDVIGTLKVEVPASATEVQKFVDPMRLQFFMPNDQWRDYVADYFPDKRLTKRPYRKEMPYNAPAWCIPAVRSGIATVHWTTGDDIPYFDTDRHVYRFVSVTPDCEPGKAYVQWLAGDPE